MLFYRREAVYCISTILVGTVTYIISRIVVDALSEQKMFIQLLALLALCMIITTFLLTILYSHTIEFKQTKSWIMNKVKK